MEIDSPFMQYILTTVSSSSTPSSFPALPSPAFGDRVHIGGLHQALPLRAWGTTQKKERKDCRYQKEGRTPGHHDCPNQPSRLLFACLFFKDFSVVCLGQASQQLWTPKPNKELQFSVSLYPFTHIQITDSVIPGANLSNNTCDVFIHSYYVWRPRISNILYLQSHRKSWDWCTFCLKHISLTKEIKHFFKVTDKSLFL